MAEVSLHSPCEGHRSPLGETVKVVLRRGIDPGLLAEAVADLRGWERVVGHVGEVIDPYDHRRRLVVEHAPEPVEQVLDEAA